MTPKLVKLTLTCGACPTQYEGELEDGRMVYIRYRWGTLEVGFGKDVDEAIDNREWSVTIGEGLDGFIEYNKIVEVTKEILDFSGITEPVGY